MSQYLTTEALRKALGGVSERTIQGWIKTGALPQPVRMSERFNLWPIKEVEEHLATRRHPYRQTLEDAA